MTMDNEHIEAQRGAFESRPTQWWHRHLMSPTELEHYISLSNKLDDACAELEEVREKLSACSEMRDRLLETLKTAKDLELWDEVNGGGCFGTKFQNELNVLLTEAEAHVGKAKKLLPDAGETQHKNNP